MSNVPMAADVAELTDEEVVSRVTAGDRAKFEILMRRHNQRIYRTVRALVRSEEEIEDVMQQTYLNAFAHLDQYMARSQFSTWLTRIAINEVLGRRRRRRAAFGETADDGILDFADPTTPDPERQALSTELRRVIEDETCALPDAFRLTFMMRDVEGLSTAETASCLGISEDLVRTRLHRARMMLRERLDRRVGGVTGSTFTFGGSRCDGLVRFVMLRIT
jgi:RNA polymerase sigma-70 factor (ECF subfamily)